MVRIGGAGKITSKLGKQAGQSEPTASQSGKTWSSNFCLVVPAIFTFSTPLSLNRSQQLGFMYLKSHILHLIADLPTFVMCTFVINIIVLNVFRSCYLNRWFCKFRYISVSTIDLLGPGQHSTMHYNTQFDVLHG